MALTPKQQRFVTEYLIDLNATQAAIRAGYSPHTASRIGPENLSKPVVQSAIESAMAARQQRTELSADRIVKELMLVAFGDLRRLYKPDGSLKSLADMTAEEAAQLSGVEADEMFAGSGEDRSQIGYTRKVKRWDKVKALELLGKHVGLFTDRIQHTGPGGGPIKYEGVTVTPADVADARIILGIAAGDVHPDGRPQPVEPQAAAPQAAGVPAAQ